MNSSEKLNLNTSTRTAKKKDVAELRNQGIVPGVVYGHGLDNQIVQLELKQLLNVYKESGESTLINLTVDEGKSIPVLIHDITRDVVTDIVQHVDFFAVNMNEKIQTEVVVHYTGISMAVKDLNGILVKSRDHITIKCLPGDLIAEVEVDLSVLATFEDAIHISDVKFPDTVEVLDAGELTMATVTPPRTEEELASLDEEVKESVEEVEGAAENAPAEGGDEKAAE